jgi:DNA-binding GntR family transcriptional regulator
MQLTRPTPWGSAERGSARAPTRDERIYQDLYAAIVENELPPGTKLTEEHLANIFRVSRTSIRKVLFRLAHENLVTLQPNRGASVARPTVEEVREVYVVRRLLETNMVRAIGDRITRAQIQHLRRVVARERAANARGDRKRALIVSGEFHLELARILHNPTLAQILRELISRGSLALAIYERPGRAGCRCEEHADVVENLAAGDAEAAAASMEKHLHGIEAGLDLGSVPRRPVNLREILARERRR